MTLETPEEKDAFRHVEQMANMPKHFAGNYEGPLYAPHPDLTHEKVPEKASEKD